jgi:L-asparagine transporter-like permease
MVFSLARGGYAPQALGHVSGRGTPVRALMVSAGGLAIATLFAILYPNSAYVYMFGIALFGGLFVWLMIFVTHLFFRRQWVAQGGRELPVQIPLFPVTTIIGALAVLAIIVSTWWVPGMRPTLESGIPWLAALTVLYYAWGRNRRRV